MGCSSALTCNRILFYFRTLKDKKNEEDEDDQQKFYVGGTDGHGGGSGLSVLGPPPDDPYAGMKASSSAASESDPSKGATITLYRDGFVVNDGPFRALSDPANRAFVDSMNRG